MENIICYDSEGQLLSHYTQWDVNQKLVISGADISSAPDFHFLNTLQRDAYVVKSQISGNFLIASVPDELLQHDVPIIVHIYYVPGTTEYTVRIPVMPRRKPDNYIYTDTESGGGSASGQVYIANNLTTNDPDMALSAAQGVVIKSMIDNIGDSAEIADKIYEALESAKNSGEFNGRGIISIIRTSGTGAAGTLDTYTINYTDGTTSTFQVRNGADGAGGGTVGAGTLFVTKSDSQCSHTSSEIYEAINSGAAVFLIDHDLGYVCSCNAVKSDTAVFSTTVYAGVDRNNITASVYTIYVDSSGRIISEDLTNMHMVPMTSDATSGKYLKDSGNGIVWADIPSGSGSGENGATFTPHVDENGNLSWTNDKNLQNPNVVNIKGEDGRGIVSITKSSGSGAAGTRDTYTILYTDNTTSQFSVYNGADGSGGSSSSGGKDGFSPIVSVRETDNGHNITITDVNGDQSFFIPNGQSGLPGVGIQSIVQTTTSNADGGTNIITATLTDGKTATFSIKNGSAGGRDGGNADTLDGKHADSFALAENVDNAIESLIQELPNLHSHSQYVTENVVQNKITAALDGLEINSGNKEIFNISLDYDSMTSSHSASEISNAVSSGILPIINGNTSLSFDGFYSNPYSVSFVGYHADNWGRGSVYEARIYDDKSFDESYVDNIRSVHVVTVDENNIASHNSLGIDDIAWNNDAHVVKVFYNGYTYDYKYCEYNEDTGVLITYFDFSASDANGKFTSVISIDNDGRVEVVSEAIEPIIPLPDTSDPGKVLRVGEDGHVSWGNALDDMILSPSQYGDKLPGEDGEQYTHVPGRLFFKREVE